MAPADETIEREDAIERLNAALTLQYRSALHYATLAAALTGPGALALGTQLTEFAGLELAGVRAITEKVISFEGEPVLEVAELRFSADPDEALTQLVECEREAVEALQAAIEPTGREGRSEALEHTLEHQIMRKQRQLDLLERATR